MNNINSLKNLKKSNSFSVIIRKSISKILNKNISNVVNKNKKEKSNNGNIIKKCHYNNNNDALEKIVHKSKKKVKTFELYGQNFNLEYFRKIPPKTPELFNHIYNIKNINVFTKDNETLGNLNKDIIPNVYYNHMIYNRDLEINNNKCKYLKSCIVQRNKKKISSIIYYFPCY